MRSFLFVSLAILVTLALSGVRGFSPSRSINQHCAAEWRTASAFTPSSSSSPCSPTSSTLTLANRDDDDRRVRVDLIEDIDPITLTAVGFGLIAFNFFVLGNLGDGGIGGFVARIINTFG